MNLFNPDSRIIQALQSFGSYMLLNLCFLLCCLPVFTAGVSAIALFDVTLREADSRSGSMTSRFFSSFAANFKKAAGLWLLLLLMACIIGYNYIFLYANPGLSSGFIRGILIALTVIYLMILTYAIPLAARYENTVFNTLRNALALAIGNLPRTVVMMLINALPLLILYFNLKFFVAISVVFVMIYFAGAAYVDSRILIKIFHRMDENAR